MKLVELGVIARPHGFRGAFVVSHAAGKESALSYVKEVWIGASPETATLHQIVEAAWMPSGWKVQVEKITSDVEVKTLRGNAIYADRDLLPKLEEDSYYVDDLFGAKVIESETQEWVGTFLSVEAAGNQTWWNILYKGEPKLVPAKRHFIESVDAVAKEIRLRNLKELP